jgi:sigma-B regulation protein RsbU (phosphoserine phosphatase)
LAGTHQLGAEAQTLFDAAPCGLIRTAPDGTFLRVNRTFCNWIEYPCDELIGRRKFQDLLTIGGRIFHQTHWAPLLSMQGSVSEVKLELLQRGGATLPMVVNAIVREDHGELVHELSAYVARDRDKYERELVHSRKRLQELLAEKQQLHEQAQDRALFAEQMIGIVSHDLRNPIATIQTGTVLLASGAAEHTRERVVTRIARASERAARLIEDLLDFTQARVGSGLHVSPGAIDLHALVGEAVDELRLAHPGRSLEHDQNGSGECQGDASRLEQLVGNLVSNALTYGRPDAPVTVSSQIDATTCAISVHNLGAPIPPDVQGAIFRPMTRGTQGGGSKRSVGLGLFIVSEITKAHGGTTQVESTAEAGTTFRAILPRS